MQSDVKVKHFLPRDKTRDFTVCGHMPKRLIPYWRAILMSGSLGLHAQAHHSHAKLEYLTKTADLGNCMGITTVCNFTVWQQR
jgi:hypothetical protein